MKLGKENVVEHFGMLVLRTTATAYNGSLVTLPRPFGLLGDECTNNLNTLIFLAAVFC